MTTPTQSTGSLLHTHLAAYGRNLGRTYPTDHSKLSTPQIPTFSQELLQGPEREGGAGPAPSRLLWVSSAGDPAGWALLCLQNETDAEADVVVGALAQVTDLNP